MGMDTQGAQERVTRSHFVDDLSREEKEELIAQYRAEGFKSIAVREDRQRAAGTGFATCYVFDLGRKE